MGNHNPISRIAIIVLLLLISGCRVDLHPIPRNADPREKDAVAVLKPICEYIAWNEDGRVWTLDVGGEKTTDETLEYVGRLSDLMELNLIGTSVSDDGLVHLKSLKKLKGLGLRATQITDDGVVHLQHIPNLTVVDLSHTQITDAAMKHLEKLPKLERLFIDSTRVTDRGVERLQKALPECVIQYGTSSNAF